MHSYNEKTADQVEKVPKKISVLPACYDSSAKQKNSRICTCEKLKQTSENTNTENKQGLQTPLQSARHAARRPRVISTPKRARFDQLKPTKVTAQAAKSIIQPNPPAQRRQCQAISFVCAPLSLSLYVCRSVCVYVNEN